MAGPPGTTRSPEEIGNRIVVVRGEKVLLDGDLAQLYGVTTKRLNEQVKRNRRRFPSDFVFRLKYQDLVGLRSQNATSKGRPGKGGRRYLPLAFTEHGALMAANVLKSDRAIEVSLYVVRAFVRLREALASHKELASKLEQHEQRTAALANRHDALAADTRAQFRQVIAALRQLMSTPEPKRRPIGFVTDTEAKNSKPA
jgi:plasmid maintenance system antidote protein VapI